MGIIAAAGPREEAEATVNAWDRDEPHWSGILRVEQIELRTGTAN
jgi:hypothetical protein